MLMTRYQASVAAVIKVLLSWFAVFNPESDAHPFPDSQFNKLITPTRYCRLNDI